MFSNFDFEFEGVQQGLFKRKTWLILSFVLVGARGRYSLTRGYNFVSRALGTRLKRIMGDVPLDGVAFSIELLL